MIKKIKPLSPDIYIGKTTGDNTLARIAHVNQLVDQINNNSSTLPYKVYTALLTQNNQSAPVPTVLENTLGGTVAWTRDSAGNYIGTLNGAFTAGKTVCFYTHDGYNGNTGFGGAIRKDSNTVWISFNDPSGTYIDSQGDSDSIEIRVYN
jgi:hypothetical protein